MGYAVGFGTHDDQRYRGEVNPSDMRDDVSFSVCGQVANNQARLGATVQTRAGCDFARRAQKSMYTTRTVKAGSSNA